MLSRQAKHGASFKLLRFVVLAWAITIADAHACSWDRGLTDEDHFRSASAVFVAHVFKTEEVRGISPLGSESETLVEATFRVIETLKGRAPWSAKVRSSVFEGGNCSLRLVVAQDYLFFLYEDNFVLFPGGSRPITLGGPGIEPILAKKLLTKLRALAATKK